MFDELSRVALETEDARLALDRSQFERSVWGAFSCLFAYVAFTTNVFGALLVSAAAAGMSLYFHFHAIPQRERKYLLLREEFLRMLWAKSFPRNSG